MSTPKVEVENPVRIFGIGVKTFNLFSESSESPYLMPGNKLILTINPHKNFRIQPEIGYARSKYFEKDVNADLISVGLTSGIGMYGMWRKEKTNLYAGFKYVLNMSKDDNREAVYGTYPNYTTTYIKTTTVVKTSMYGLVLGGEYFFSRHFSVGTEIGLMAMKMNIDFPTSQSNSSYNQEDIIVNSLLTESNLLFRFYF